MEPEDSGRVTRRQRLIQLLQEQPRTIRELSVLMGATVKDVAEDLDHVSRSLKGRLKVEPAVCEGCGFVFQNRRRFTKPSRCPRCRTERIDGPVLSVEP